MVSSCGFSDFVERSHCEIVFPKALFGVAGPFSAARFVPSGFSDRRFETAPDLSFSKHVNPVLAKLQLISNQSVRLGN